MFKRTTNSLCLGGFKRSSLLRCPAPPVVGSSDVASIWKRDDVTSLKGQWKAVAEWDTPRAILMHRPNHCGELTIPVIHPATALFEDAFDPDTAFEDHVNYTNMLNERGIDTLMLKDVIIEAGKTNPGVLSELRNLAKATITLDLSAIPEEEHVQHRHSVYSAIDAFSTKRVFNMIVNRPRIKPLPTGTNTGLAANYEVQPLMNLYFLRDQMITTCLGPVMSRMSSRQRQAEVSLVELALEFLESPPIYRVSGPGTLEGGDFITAGDWAFLGQGLRTNAEGVQQLLNHGVFGNKYVCIVKDNWRSQTEMHLDTFFNVAGKHVCCLVETRLYATRGSKYWLDCDVYEKSGDKYRLLHSDRSFMEVLADCGYHTIIPVTKEDQMIYGCNFLTVGHNDIILVKRNEGISNDYRQRLEKAGVKYEEAEMHSLTKGYGAAHCTTQPCRIAAPSRTSLSK